jgi:hypothetical protein
VVVSREAKVVVTSEDREETVLIFFSNQYTAC